jgi:drug/metabolite transporter (DMT)-like permease
VLAALITALLWTCSSIASAQTAQRLGGPTANRTRLLIAVVLLCVWAAWDGLVAGTGAWWFLLSGALGLGLGDYCLFCAYERLGARLPALFTHCLAAPLGAALEWAWLGNALTASEALCIALILIGVLIALAPDQRPAVSGTRARFWAGCAFGVGSACGLALAAVTSRMGYAVAISQGQPMPWNDAAFWRNIGGLAVMLAGVPVGLVLHHATGRLDRQRPARNWRGAIPWLIATALAGPTVGVAFYQLALSQVKAGVVQAVLALIPLLVIPLTWLVEGDRPTRRSLLGGAVAVCGVVILVLWR